jgi:flagellar protein FlgJ
MHTDSPPQTPLFFCSQEQKKKSFKEQLTMIPKISTQPLAMISTDKNKVDVKNDTSSGELSRNDKIKKQFREVSELYEKQFLREMVKSMRSTVSESGLIKTNQAEKIFKEQLDNEYVEKWGEKGGIGISELIYNNMMDRFGEKLGLKEKIDKPSGPLALKDKDTYQVKTGKLPESQDGMQFFFNQVKAEDSKPVAIDQPWTGYLAKKLQLAPDEYFLEMNHENGLKSQMHFKGKILDIKENEVISQGQSIGYLSLDNNSFSWAVKK